ncbi:radical SAM/SPASM domain-containing protein [Vagococcus elongatus]|uniref:Radical SAM/SPASM domain-containing protein n=1 Tax=Vagococcus elongatus TaxID=180344 RepID=A0A430B161_9ENTE|nr:radical SAM protein [Vagococcus elongatus]RSU14070.1 radical SAM/SPASM domain-containing protein [Vagococcus elongatus]
MKHVSVLIKPASGLCNIRCQYCFYADVTSLREVESYGRMTKETTEKMIAQIFSDLENGDQLTLAFQGGEPTLAGLNYYRHLTSLVDEYIETIDVEVHYAIQTNGIVVNERWCRLFKDYDFLVGLSIDGPAMFHDLYRLDAKGRGTYQRVLKTKKLLDDYAIDYNVLCVLTNQLAGEPKKVYRFLQKENIDYVQFIPCLDDFGAEKRSRYALTPKRFASFYQQLFQLWLDEFKRGTYRSVKLFDDVFNLLVAGQLTACGILGNCQIQYVIEADGSVYPCDFYVLDNYRLGYIQEKSLRELFEQDVSKMFLCEPRDLSGFCQECPFLKMCNGGCKRMKDAMYVNKQGDFCGYQTFLKKFVPQIETIIETREKVIR